MQDGIPAVSVICTAYNQFEYIRDALDGFVAQKASFPFEIIVHDDASTDGTADVIRDYSFKYPELIKPIMQRKNQHSKGKSVLRDYCLPEARGRYVALCEGDDYWASSRKLQVQFEVMEANPECSICVHNALVIDYFYSVLYLSEKQDCDKTKDAAEVIVEGGGVVNPTASFFFRKDCLGERIAGAPVGDHFILMDLAAKGEVRWLSEPLSVYRYGSIGSWSVKDRMRDIDLHRGFHAAYIDALNEFDGQTGGRYKEAIARRVGFQEKTCLNEVSIESYREGLTGYFALLKACGLGKTALKSLARKHLSCEASMHVGKAFTMAKHILDGTFVSSSINDLPIWALPLSNAKRNAKICDVGY